VAREREINILYEKGKERWEGELWALREQPFRGVRLRQRDEGKDQPLGTKDKNGDPLHSIF